MLIKQSNNSSLKDTVRSYENSCSPQVYSVGKFKMTTLKLSKNSLTINLKMELPVLLLSMPFQNIEIQDPEQTLDNQEMPC